MRAVLCVFLILPVLVQAHSGAHPVRYVAVDGVDSGQCQLPENPCASIAYAVDKSQKGDQIRVAGGDYSLNELDIFYLLSDMVKIYGSYSRADAFKKQDIKAAPSRLIGLPAEYRESLAERGFLLLQDRKGLDNELGGKEKIWLQQYKALTSVVEGPQACEAGKAGNNDCHNIDRVAHIPLAEFSSRPSSANDIWGFVDLNNQREYALIGLSNGTAVVDVSDAENPVEAGFIAGAFSTWRDIKVYQYHDGTEYKAYAYVTTETEQGLQIIDLSQLPDSVSLAANPRNHFSTAHNVYIANVDYSSGLALEGMNPFLYIAGSNTAGGVFLSFDLNNPLAPNLIASGNRGYIHDGTSFVIDDERTASCAFGHRPCEIFVDFNENTVDIWDMTDKTAPFRISSSSYPQSAYTHSGWWSEDKQTVFVQDELDEMNFGLNTTLRAMDISNLAAPRVVGVFRGTTQAIDHNGFTLGSYYYMSNYRRGLTVIDVSNPAAMREVAFFDTFAVPQANTANFNGAWGTYPFLPSGNILVSDIEYGLWILKLNENDGELPAPSPSFEPVPDSPSSSGSGGGVVSWHFIVLGLLLCWRRRSFAINKR